MLRLRQRVLARRPSPALSLLAGPWREPEGVATEAHRGRAAKCHILLRGSAPARPTAALSSIAAFVALARPSVGRRFWHGGRSPPGDEAAADDGGIGGH